MASTRRALTKNLERSRLLVNPIFCGVFARRSHTGQRELPMASTRRAARGLARWVAAPRADAVERVGSNRSGASRAVAGVAHLQDRRLEERSPARSRRRSFFSVPDLDAMRERVFSSSKLVRHPPEKLFQVVADVARYEEFVPFCASSRVLRVLTPTRFEAELEIGFKVFSERYVSDVTLEEDPATGEKKVTATAIPPRGDGDGLFQRLVSTWRFKPGRAPDETAVAFDLDFKVNSVVHSQVVALVFEEVSRLQIGAFESRCDELFGGRRESRGAASDEAAASSERASVEAKAKGPNGDEDVGERVEDAKKKTFPRVKKDPATRARVLAAFAHAASNPTPRAGEDDDLTNPHPGLGLRDFSNACRELENIAPFGPATANRPFLCAALHAALDVAETGRVADADAARAADLYSALASRACVAEDEEHEELELLTFESALELITKQLRFLKTRMPNVARLASSQQRRALEGEELSGSDDEGKDFDILLETAMADVVVEHNLNDAERLARELVQTLRKTGAAGLRAWRLASEADPAFLGSKSLEGILRLGVFHRLTREPSR